MPGGVRRSFGRGVGGLRVRPGARPNRQWRGEISPLHCKVSRAPGQTAAAEPPRPLLGCRHGQLHRGTQHHRAAPPPRGCTHWSTTSTAGPSWSPWEDLDPALERTYTGPDHGVGARYAWSGNRKAGRGSMEITDSSPEAVGITLEFLKPFKSTSQTRFVFEPSGAGHPGALA